MPGPGSHAVLGKTNMLFTRKKNPDESPTLSTTMNTIAPFLGESCFPSSGSAAQSFDGDFPPQLRDSRRLLPAPIITPQTRPASLSLIAEQFPFVQQDYSTFQCASFHPFQSYNCACASLAVWLCNLGGNSDNKGVLLCHCVSGSHRNILLGWRM